MKHISKEMKGILFILPTVGYLMVICIYPLVNSIKMSFYDESGGETVFVGLAKYIEIFKSGVIWQVLQNSCFFTGFTVLFHLLIGLFFALILNRDLKYKKLWGALQFIPWLFPPAVVACIWLLIYQPQYGLINTILYKLNLSSMTHDWLGEPRSTLVMITIANIWSWYPFFSLILLAAMQSIPSELYEAAKIDGAARWDSFWYMTIPMLKPVILTTCLLDAIWTFRFFDLVWIMTQGGPIRASEIMPTFVFKTAFHEFDFHTAATLGGIMLLIMASLSIGYLKAYRSPK